MPSNNATIAIAVITYKRPGSLASTLQSLQQLILPAGAEVKLIVVDNDSGKTALSAVNAIKGEMPFAVEYMVEERRGIPHARNAALMAAVDCDYLAFIDDDDMAAPEWLSTLYAAMRHYNADVVKGQVVYSFPAKKEHLQRLDIFAAVPVPTGAALDSAWTNNVLLSTKIYKESGLKFDPAFVKTGGSDHDFFFRAKKAGAHIIMCQEAIVHSPVPIKRCRLEYLAMRHIRVGATMTIADCRQGGYLHGMRQVAWAFGDSGKYAFKLARGAVKGEVPLIHPTMVLLFLYGRVIGLCRLSPREYR